MTSNTLKTDKKIPTKCPTNVANSGFYALDLSHKGRQPEEHGGKEMKLVATDQTVTIKWFAVLHDGSKMRNVKGFIHNAWDIQCSCGWESRTGGAIKACVQRIAEEHKWSEHNYSWTASTKEAK